MGKAFIATLCGFVVTYLGTAFVQLCFDPSVWSLEARAFTVIVALVTGGSWALASVMPPMGMAGPPPLPSPPPHWHKMDNNHECSYNPLK